MDSTRWSARQTGHKADGHAPKACSRRSQASRASRGRAELRQATQKRSGRQLCLQQRDAWSARVSTRERAAIYRVTRARTGAPARHCEAALSGPSPAARRRRGSPPRCTPWRSGVACPLNAAASRGRAPPSRTREARRAADAGTRHVTAAPPPDPHDPATCVHPPGAALREARPARCQEGRRESRRALLAARRCAPLRCARGARWRRLLTSTRRSCLPFW